MKIIYGCYPSIFSLKIANGLVKRGIPITHMMLSTKVICIEGHSIHGLSGLGFLFRRFGLRYTIFQIFCSVVLPIVYSVKAFIHGERLYSFKQLCLKNNIQMIKSSNFNEDIKLIEKPDIFISMCLDQKLNNSFFKKMGTLCVNVHPSDIPNFGGVEPIIQLKLSSEEQMGITIHNMTEQLDNGEAIMRRYVSAKNKSYLNLMQDFIDNGISMLGILHNNKWIKTKCSPIEQKYPYRSWPTHEELVLFSKQNKYIKLTDLF